jgi:CheY-like chemotaxis protein
MAHILVVDDDSVIRELLVEVLAEESGHHVIVASNGQEALRQLEQHTVDAIVCDVNMPVMNGFELVRHVRANTDYEHLPVLLISAAARLEHADPDLEVDMMLEKPFELNSLLACVGFLLNGVRAGARAGMRTVRVGRRHAATRFDRIVLSHGHHPRLSGSAGD